MQNAQPDRDDAALILAIAEGSEDAMEALVTRHGASILRYAGAVVRDEGAAEDVLQETIFAAWRGAHSFRGGDPRAWLLTIARHVAWRHDRRRAGEPDHFTSLDQLALEAGWGADPEKAALRVEDRRLLHRALEELSPADREIVALRDLEELSGEEAAAVLGISIAAVKTRLHRARLRLAGEMRRSGHGR